MFQAPYLNQVIIECSVQFNVCFQNLKLTQIFFHISLSVSCHTVQNPGRKQTIMVKYCVSDTACMDSGGSLEQL